MKIATVSVHEAGVLLATAHKSGEHVWLNIRGRDDVSVFPEIAYHVRDFAYAQRLAAGINAAAEQPESEPHQVGDAAAPVVAGLAPAALRLVQRMPAVKSAGGSKPGAA